MKRSGPPRRTKGLHVDQDKVREFLKKRRKPLARKKPPDRSSAGLSRSDGPKRTGGRPKRSRRRRPAEGPLTPDVWAQEVYRLDRGRCVVTGTFIHLPNPANFHHAIPKQELRRRKLWHLVYDARNGITVTERVHAQHEAAMERVPREKLPARVEEFASELGTWAEALLDRVYGPRPADPGTRRPEEVT